MPNTLAHLGLQGFLTRSFWKNADLKWIYLGCVIPDFSWIFQRVLQFIYPGVDRYSLLLYTSIQASLCFCLILSAAVASFSLRPCRTFAILGIGCFLHLLLDACQIKWANGVHFMAPFSWQLTNIGFFWPESIINYLVTGFGLVYILAFWKKSVSAPFDITFRPSLRLFLCALLIIIYFACPLLLFDGLRKADNYFVITLQDNENRAGKFVSLDRAKYLYDPDGSELEVFSGERLEVEGIAVDKSRIITLSGYFVTENKIQVQSYHIHKSRWRDISSLIGLCLVILLWINAGIKDRKRRRN